MLLGTCPRAVVCCVLCVLSGFAAPGGCRCLTPVRVPWLWPAACLSGVPRGPAWCAAPQLVRSFSVLRSASLTPWCLPPTQGLAPLALLGGCAGHAEAGREPGSLCLPLAPAEAGALGSLRVVPVRGPAMGLSLAGPSGVGLGLRALRWLAGHRRLWSSVPSVVRRGTRPVHRGCFLWTPTSPPAGWRTPRPGPVRVCVCLLFLAGSGGRASRARSGAPDLLLWLLCLSASLGPLQAGVAPVLILCLPSRTLFRFFLPFLLLFSLPPLCLLVSLVSVPRCPGPWRFVLFVLLASRFLALIALSLSSCCLAVGRSPVVPPPLSLAVVAVPRCLAPFFFLLLYAPPLSRAFCVLEPWEPWALALVCVCCARLSVLCVFPFFYSFFFPPTSRFFVFSPLFCVSWLAGGCSPVVAAPPPYPSVSGRFRRSCSLPGFFFTLPLCAPVVSGFLWFLALGALGLGAVFCFFSRPTLPGSPCAHGLFVSTPWPLAAPWWLLPPPPSPFVSRGFRRSCSVPCFFFPLCALVVPGLLWFPALGCPGGRGCALFALLAFRLPALRALSPLSCFPPGRWLLPGGRCPPPPPCVSRFSSLPLSAVCHVLCCAVCPGVRCCAALLRVVPPGVVLSCAVLLCCAPLVPLLVAPCPLALPVALGPCALRRCVSQCSPALCALCFVCFFVAWLCMLLFAALLCAVCVPGCCAVRSLCSLLCAVLCFAVLVRLRCAVCVVRAVAGTWCCGALLCVLLFPLVCCGAVLGLVARGSLLVGFFCVGVPVWQRGLLPCGCCGLCGALPPCVVFCGAALSRGAVLLCSAVVLRCCQGLLCPPVACRAVLCCAVGWLCCLLPGGGVCVLWCSFPCAVRSLSSPLCALR